ncbi:hypothetical protein ACWDTI_09000 [Gordonia sp. NPDC003424]
MTSASGSPAFGISREEAIATASVWRSEASRIESLDVTALSTLPGSSSLVLTALRTTAQPARRSTASIAAALTSTAAAITRFADRASTDDRSAAGYFGRGRHR